ncbi:response regulator transcription factor [uncultured Thiodictyon sp.]|uniref:LuxR C-terminal-related transcriptional regulator n=1 Tax=uncultured Thiodictyon sp. TaxID=1846217 RepID=UPI0025E7448F|nr:response regulator transcription factor [uncultured Thiodictyon sp.]
MSINLILADAQAMVRQGLAALLRAESDVALLAQTADGEIAWTLIADHAPQVAILDLCLPKASGIEIARRVEAAALDTRVLLLALHDTPAAALSAQQAGAMGYVLKDRPFEELICAVRAVAAGQTFITPSVRAKLRTMQRNGDSTAPLSAREQEVVCLMAKGHSSKEIARILTISPGTVNTHRKRLMKKLGLHTAIEVVRWGVQGGVIV